MIRRWYKLFVCLLLFSCSAEQKDSLDVASKSWDDITQAAEGKHLTMMMWQGDMFINRYMSDYVVPEVKERFNIDLEIVNGQGNVIVNHLMTELEAGKEDSEIDLVWINGETFYQLRQIDALYGPFVEKLPNSEYVNWESPFIKYDFQQEVNGYESPWGNVQLSLIYNSDMVQDPPQDLKELELWVKENPGKFTFDNHFTGLTLLKSWMIALGGKENFKGDFNKQLYDSTSAKLWNYVNQIKPYLWKEGKTFPASVAQMHQLFANGEIAFTMSNNDGEVENKIRQGVFPENSFAYVPASGTIQNSHYLGIPVRSPKKEAALIVINFLLSPEAQYQKMLPEIWGDGTVLSIEKLPDAWQEKFRNIPGRQNASKREEITERAFMEPAPEYMIRLSEDFRKKIIEED